MSGPGGVILEDRRENSFLHSQGVDERWVPGCPCFLVSQQCDAPQAILISHSQLGSPLVRICRGVHVYVHLSLSTCNNRLLRCSWVTATELSRSRAAPTSSTAGPPGHPSGRNSTAWAFGDSPLGKRTLAYITRGC